MPAHIVAGDAWILVPAGAGEGGATVAVWDVADLPDEHGFAVVCALLGEHALDDGLADYPITLVGPICDAGFDPPMPVWARTDR